MFYGYVRVSTQDQGDKGNGIAAQEDLIRSQYPEAVIFVDVVSGSTPLEKRPALIDLLSQMKKGDTVVLKDRSRMGRGMLINAGFEGLMKASKVSLVFCDGASSGIDESDPMAVIQARIVDLIAEIERLNSKARTKAALAAKKARAQKYNHPAYGFTANEDTKTLEKEPTEQALVETVKALKEQGLSLRKISARVYELGFRSRSKSGKLAPQSVKNIINFTPSKAMSSLQLTLLESEPLALVA